MPQPPLLDLDVLEHICHSIRHTQTVLSFSLVSHALHDIAVKRLLSMEPVSLKDERTIRTFHAFILVNPESRLPFLRALNISVTEVETQFVQDISQFILDVLERATHLETLTLPYPRQTFRCLQDSRVPEAVAQLSTLRELDMLEDCREVDSIVKSTCSAASLRTLRVSLSSLRISGRRGAYGIQITDLDVLLQGLTPTLEILDIREAKVVLDAVGAQYPTLRSFAANIEQGMVHTDTLVSKFPALLRLSIGLVVEGELQVEADVQEQRRLRASNQEWQKKHRGWPYLDRATGDVLGLFVLGLTCPVRHLMVDGFGVHKKGQMADVLRATPPACLKLSTVLYYGDDIFEDLFPPEVFSRLTHLVLLLVYTNLQVDDEDQDVDVVGNAQWSTLLPKIIDSIRALHLTHLRLFVHYRIDLTDDEEDRVPYSMDFVRSIVGLDHIHLATHLLDAVPSLQYVFVSTGGEFEVGEPPMESQRRGRWFSHSAWRNTRGGSPGTETLMRLDTDVMEQMLQDEDLMLSDLDDLLLGFQQTWGAEETAPWPLPE